jgi:hypothetical protein
MWEENFERDSERSKFFERDSERSKKDMRRKFKKITL